MSIQLAGQCHCGAIRVVLEPGQPTAELPFRACQCGFCRRPGAATTSHPESHLHIEATPDPADYHDETDDQRLFRRRARWMPAIVVETLPSA